MWDTAYESAWCRTHFWSCHLKKLLHVSTILSTLVQSLFRVVPTSVLSSMCRKFRPHIQILNNSWSPIKGWTPLADDIVKGIHAPDQFAVLVSPCIPPRDMDFRSLDLESMLERNENTKYQIPLLGVNLWLYQSNMQSEVFLLENALEHCVELYLQDSSIDCFWSRVIKILFHREYTELEHIIVQ